MTAPAGPFADLSEFLALPRLSGLALSPDGARLVTSVAVLDPAGSRWVSALWEVDPAGGPAQRLTRSAKGESAPAFTDAGDLLFCSARPDPEAPPEDEAPPALWVLPAAGGEARVVGARPGGMSAPGAAGQVVVVTSDTLPASTDSEDDASRRKARKDGRVTAVLHRSYPVRHWDADLGPGAPRLLAGRPGGTGLSWVDLTPDAGRALDGTAYDVGPDGATVVAVWAVAEPRGGRRTTLVAVDTATGERRVLADDETCEYDGPQVSPDGRQVACLQHRRSTPSEPGDTGLVVLPLDGGAGPRAVAPGWDRWPTSVRWSADGTALLATADEGGAGPVFRVELGDGTVTRLTADDGAYTDLCVAPDGDGLYALRSAVDAPPAVVRLAATGHGQLPEPLRGPAAAAPLPGRLEQVRSRAQDGSELRAWLVLPPGQGPHPLVLWVHGGPLNSWNAWSWRWCPWVLAARGYAVLLPDPALSTGYGRSFVARGWGRWGDPTYDDLMRVTDAALERDDLDAQRTAAMGGSFGGYLTNWIAGHTQRFRALVTHASLWALDQFAPTTDSAYYWREEMTPEMAAANDPSQFADAVRTPMLVVHGDRDYRVPVGEALRLWWDLCSRAEDPATMPHRFLYFPDEGHWVLQPQHAVLWYQTVLGFLDTHLLGAPESVPELLR